MPTPLFTFRLPKKDQAILADLAKVYGSANSSAFLRELIAALTGRDEEGSRKFYARLMDAAGLQLQLQLTEQAAAGIGVPTVRVTAKKRGRRGRGRP
jgi:hypothetical protein